MHLGFWYVNQDVVVNIAKTVDKLLTQDAVSDYYRNDENSIQKGLLLQLLAFWATEVERNISSSKELLKQLISILSKLCFSGGFLTMLKNHPLLKVLVQLSKNEKLDVSYQKGILKIINAAAKGIAVNIQPRPMSNQSASYIPSFVRSGSVGDDPPLNYNPNDI
jgi:hypothetical protein